MNNLQHERITVLAQDLRLSFGAAITRCIASFIRPCR
jgi:hypothetical protein